MGGQFVGISIKTMGKLSVVLLLLHVSPLLFSLLIQKPLPSMHSGKSYVLLQNIRSFLVLTMPCIKFACFLHYTKPSRQGCKVFYSS